MSKYLFTADWHIQDNSLMDRAIGSRYFDDKMSILEKIIEYCNKNGYNNLFMLGDVFNSPSPSIKERIAFHKLMNINDRNKTKITILMGNHDYEKHGFNFFEEAHHIPGPRLYDVCSKSRIQNVKDKDMYVQSWKASKDTVIIPKKCKFWLGHLSVKNFHMSEMTKCKVGLDPSEGYFKVKYCIFGHFHIPAKIGNIRYVGSPYPISFGEGDKEKRVLSYDSDTDKLTSIPIAWITDGFTLGLSTLNIREKKHIKMIHYQVGEGGGNSLKGMILRLKYNPCIIKRSKIDRLVNWLNDNDKPYYIDVVPEGLSSINIESIDKNVNKFTFIKNFNRYMKTNWKNKKLKHKALKILTEADSDNTTGIRTT